jgi:hypothetical protein
MFIHQKSVGADLQRQGNGFGFAGIQLLLQSLHKLPVGGCLGNNPDGCLHLICSRLSGALNNNLAPHRWWDDEFAIHLVEQLQLTGPNQANQRRGIADNLHNWPNSLRLARSASYL